MIKQCVAPVWIGAVKAQFGRAQFYANIAILIFSMIGARTQLLSWFPWLNFGLLLLLFVLLYCLIMVLDYVFILPSEMVYLNHQGLMHKNRAMDVLDEGIEILRRLDSEKDKNKPPV